MDSIKNVLFEIFNNLREEIVSFSNKNERENLEKFLIPDKDGRTDNLFVRRSPLTVSLLIEFILRHNPLSGQLSIEHFFDSIGQRVISKSAVSQRRTRLSPEIFKYLDNKFVSDCYTMAADALHQWHGWYLLACDGSDFALPDTDAIAKEFKRYRFALASGRQGETFPMAKCLMISDIINGFTLSANLFPYNSDERKCLDKMLEEFLSNLMFDSRKAILLLDRGFFSLKMIQTLDNFNLRYVVRVPQSSKVVSDFIASGRKEADVEWMPAKNTSLGVDSQWIKNGRKPMKLRLVRVTLGNGDIEVLATNLTPQQVDASLMKELYFKRWGIEVDFLHYKHVYQIESFSGARPVCVYQDFHAVVLCHNMVCMLIDAGKDNIERDNIHKRLDYKTNTAIFVGIFFQVFIDMIVLDRIKENLRLLHDSAIRFLTPIKHCRSYPRKRKKHKSSDRNATRTNRKRVC